MLEIKWFSHIDTPEMNTAIGDYVSGKVWGLAKPFFLSTTMGVFDEKRLIAGVIFHNYDNAAGVIEISAASETARWLSRRVLWEMYSFAFDQLSCQAVVLRVNEKDTRLCRMLSSYGHARYEIPRLRGRDTPETLFVLYDDVWRVNGFH